MNRINDKRAIKIIIMWALLIFLAVFFATKGG